MRQCAVWKQVWKNNGRPDIILKPYDERKPAVILELKNVKNYTQMEAGCVEAMQQIIDEKYTDGLREEGYLNIICYGICFCKKSCKVGKMN